MGQLDIYYRALSEYRKQINSNAECRAFTKTVADALACGADSIVIKRPICKINEDWVDAIEEGLVHIEKAIKEDRQFIRSSGEVVPIEKVKNVSRDSVQHLARHSNLISRDPKEDENIVPDGLYTLERLNDYNVYENRFLYMLLCYLRDFVTLRYTNIQKLASQYDGAMKLSGSVLYAKREIRYTVDLHEKREDDRYLRENNESKDIIERISAILNAILSFLSTPLMESVSKVAMIKPPITKTNVLKMDKNFKGAVALYDFLISYEGDGYTVEEREKKISPLTNDVGAESAEIIAVLAFIAYEHGLGISESLKREYELAEQRKKQAELESHRQQLELVKKKVLRSELSADEYILELEKHVKMLESENSKIEPLYSKIDSLKKNENDLKETIGRLNERIEELDVQLADTAEKRFAYVAGFKKDCDEKIASLIERHNEQIAAINLQMSEQRDNYHRQIEHMERITDEKRAEYEEYISGVRALEEKNLLLEARIKAIKAEHGEMSAGDDYSDRESFSDLEREYEAFVSFYEKQWGITKRKIRKRILSPKNIKRINKAGK